MVILLIGMQRPRSKQHYERPLLQKSTRREEKILGDQAEIHVEEKKAAEFKNKVNSDREEVTLSVEQQPQAATESKDVAVMQQKCRQCNSFKLQRGQERTGTVRERRRQVGKSDGNERRTPRSWTRTTRPSDVPRPQNGSAADTDCHGIFLINDRQFVICLHHLGYRTARDHSPAGQRSIDVEYPCTSCSVRPTINLSSIYLPTKMGDSRSSVALSM